MTDLIFPGLTDIVMPMKEPLCHINEIADPGAKGFELAHNDKTLAFFVVKKHGQIFGYLNKCPHVGINLEWRPDDFLNIDKSLIQCSVHGAEFIIETGHCIGGPCRGKMLDSVKLVLDAQGNVFLDDNQPF
jgi:nitrite reductase/ring-hydroxylating ferredoxin subunit